MSWKQHDYDSLPGTYVFDGKQASDSYELNRLFYSLNSAQNREALWNDPDTYMKQFDLTQTQIRALKEGDFLELLRSGGNIYYLAKMAVPRGVSVQHVGAQFQGITVEEFRENLEHKAEGMIERLEAVGGYWNG